MSNNECCGYGNDDPMFRIWPQSSWHLCFSNSTQGLLKRRRTHKQEKRIGEKRIFAPRRGKEPNMDNSLNGIFMLYFVYVFPPASNEATKEKNPPTLLLVPSGGRQLTIGPFIKMLSSPTFFSLLSVSIFFVSFLVAFQHQQHSP